MKELSDIIDYNLKILFVGFNPGLKSAEIGHHYAGNSNNFWKLLFESGLTPYKFKSEEDIKLLDLGYGSTNLADRPTKSASELTRREFEEGSKNLMEILSEYRPRIACYLGLGVYRFFASKKVVGCGIQESSVINGVIDYVCSSPSGLNRIPYKEQLECFKYLKKLICG